MSAGPPILFWVLLGMVPIWFALLKIIFVRLERRHATVFREFGEPSLFWNNSMKSSTAALGFILRRKHSSMNDAPLSRLCDFAIAYFGLYLVLFLCLFFAIPLGLIEAGY